MGEGREREISMGKISVDQYTVWINPGNCELMASIECKRPISRNSVHFIIESDFLFCAHNSLPGLLLFLLPNCRLLSKYQVRILLSDILSLKCNTASFTHGKLEMLRIIVTWIWKDTQFIILMLLKPKYYWDLAAHWSVIT